VWADLVNGRLGGRACRFHAIGRHRLRNRIVSLPDILSA